MSIDELITNIFEKMDDAIVNITEHGKMIAILDKEQWEGRSSFIKMLKGKIAQYEVPTFVKVWDYSKFIDGLNVICLEIELDREKKESEEDNGAE